MLGQTAALDSLRLLALYCVQHPERFDLYAAQKKAFVRRLGDQANERWLWHGTEKAKVAPPPAPPPPSAPPPSPPSPPPSPTTLITAPRKVPPILSNGFLRDFNSRGAYGRGVYFATHASYSLNPMYAKPDRAGERYLLLVRVLVGEACVGSAGLESPKPKPGSDELYESMVDREGQPRVVVLSAGSDNRAYPEFVLRFAA